MKLSSSVWAGTAVFLIALATRALFLGGITQVVFDEVHFGKFISSYCCTHERFFDIHPPIGKLIIAGGAYVSGYLGEFPFEHIGQEYANVPIASIRVVPALAGALLALIIFILLRQVGVSVGFSFLGGLAVALDNALIVESRFIITDSILLSATFGAVACALAATRASSLMKSILWACLAGVVAGVAVGTKFTGLVSGGLVGALFLYRAMTEGPTKFPVWMSRILLAIVCGAIIYLVGWVGHFSLLALPGSGDVWGIPTGHFWKDLLTTHQQMISANYNLTADHPYGSKWWTWPFMVRSVFYWQGQGNQFIYLLGNPVVWWGSFFAGSAGVLLMLLNIVRGDMKSVKGIFSRGAWIFVLGYAVSFVPLMRVPRVLFLYHYLTPLLFSLLIAVWWIDSLSLRNKKVVIGVMSIGMLLGYVFISPLTYGLSLSDAWYAALFTISSWR